MPHYNVKNILFFLTQLKTFHFGVTDSDYKKKYYNKMSEIIMFHSKTFGIQLQNLWDPTPKPLTPL